MTSRVFVSLRVAASPERAFDVFTGDIAAWWAPHTAFRTTPKPPGVMRFEDETTLVETFPNGRNFVIGHVTAWERPHRLAFTWRQATFPPDLITTVEVTFQAVEGQTRVSVTHAGFEAVPVESAARHGMADATLLAFLGQFWTGNLSRLNSYLGQ